MPGHEGNRQHFTDDIARNIEQRLAQRTMSGSLAEVQRKQAQLKRIVDKQSVELKSLGRMCGHIAEERDASRSQFNMLVKEVHQLREKEEYHCSWAHCQPQWMPSPRIPAPTPFRPPMYGRYPNPLAMSAHRYAPSSPPAPAGMAAPIGPFQPMYPAGSLQHPMAVPHQQAGLNEGFAGDAYYNYTEPEGTLQQAEEYKSPPDNNFSMSQEVQGSADSYAWQYPAQQYWQPQDRTVPASKQTLQPAEHLAAPEASSRQTEAEQGEQMQDELVDVDPELTVHPEVDGSDGLGSSPPTIATANPHVIFYFQPKGFNIVVAAPQPLQSPALVPAAIKPETHSGVLPPGPIFPLPTTVLAAAAAPAAMAEPGVQPAALQESCVPTTDITHGDMPSHAQRHQLQRHASLCREPEGISSSSNAEAESPANSEEVTVSGQHGPSAAPSEDVQPQLEGAPALEAIATAAPEPQTALPAPEPAATNPAAADTTQERELLPASSRDAAPAISKPAGAVPASSINKSASVLPEGRTWAVVAAQLPFKPAILPLQTSRQASQGASPGTSTQQRAVRPTSVPQQSNNKNTQAADSYPLPARALQGRSQGPSSQQQAVRQRNSNKKQGPRRGNGARGQPKTAQHEGNNQKGPGKSRVLEVKRPSTHQTGNGASQARQSSRRKDSTQPERGRSAVLVVFRTPSGQLKSEGQT